MDETEELLLPGNWGGPSLGTTPVFVAIHGAYHFLSQRVAAATAELGLSASESVVLACADREPGAAIAVTRFRTGLRPSTMTSLLGRLEAGGHVARRQDAIDHRFVELRLTAAGRSAADASAAVLADVDAELAVYVGRDRLDAARSVYEAAALLVPGRPRTRW